MAKLIVGALLVIAFFAALVALLGQRLGPVEIGVSLILLVGALALLVGRYVRERKSSSEQR
ncbi:hypothetical protein [Streptomyces sp. NPDC014746]|uniref:hypothetical protein n=1 Tax=Streptomyces sp. NPDC014746 TaxID=3364904 RepID=UPI0036FE25D5